ncbi:MAG: chorismate mutase [Burkholderiales bacterium]|nr:chorismate mutase [Burkholderiales bacterium]
MNHSELEYLRELICETDAEIISLLATRNEVVKQIGEYKKKNNLPIFNQERENTLRDFHDKICSEFGVNKNLATQIFELLILESRKVQE